ncbi:WD40/YVTN repeat-like-containing domain [Ostreococcus tauri]|uniref:WD40-repeat-containing domain protein n=1 Tax=Ostreococcus tauri TaxID=70448 RepID=A0A090LY89_OSTTA|nr:WD40/YVTN repeat-like-containing domain [Ostreococcus tauri]OUS42440.1 WD40-repeat-containing domain protein [Ostreococcus tauri]CEF96855.1 WD40/YVTN repeat-like-containing domain [Ostreococcus tauri]|eukprot:XP_003074600.2 WD40/YVTN repeat-like-containing domain [Ostreococcus tauri]
MARADALDAALETLDARTRALDAPRATDADDGEGGGGGGGKRRKRANEATATAKSIERDLRERAKKYVVGERVSSRLAGDKKVKAALRENQNLAEEAALKAAAHERWFANDEVGTLEAEEGERTYQYQQRDIVRAVDVNAAKKAFDLDVPGTGRYYVDYSRNGRELLLGSSEGALSMMQWQKHHLISETDARETVKDVKFLHNEQFYAAAQDRYTYIYDKRGLEVHCLDDHMHVNKLTFLPQHFLLCSVGTQGILRWQDTTYGKIVAQYRTKMGASNAMTHNNYNGVVHCGHKNGTVTLWSPNQGTPLVKMLCHRGEVKGVTIDKSGKYMVTSGQDGQVKVWDLRTYMPVHAYYSAQPSSHIQISQRGLLAVGWGSTVQIWKDALQIKQNSPYMKHQFSHGQKINSIAFCPYDDVLGVGHSRGFTSVLVPGAGEPNFDTFVANPFESKGQRRENEVARLLDKLPAETIQLDPDAVGKLRAVPKEVQAERRQLAIDAELSRRKDQRDKNEAKTKMKGKNRTSKRYRKKQLNVIDDKKLAKMEAKRLREAGITEKRGGVAAPGETAGAASTAPHAPDGVSKALRRFYK